MKREFHPVYVALFLVFGCVLFRLVSSHYPEALPGITPFIAISYVGGLCLSRRWGWLLGSAAFILSDFAFLDINYRTNGSMFSWWSLICPAIYAGVGLLGFLIARRASLLKIVSGSLGCSLLFYVVSNTFAWWENLGLHMTPAYPPGLAGWWQANTLGLPGYDPTWLFLRNGMIGDLGFVLVLLFILDRSLLLGHAAARTAPRAA
jgi:hypothetical protein